jgi:hypothetical protein
MLVHWSIRGTAAAAALVAMIGSAAAFDDAKYPDLKGQWRAVRQCRPARRRRRGAALRREQASEA